MNMSWHQVKSTMNIIKPNEGSKHKANLMLL